MIINNTPQNEAILSNVGEVGEFRIRNSAKAFSILSSGLYANKIRAIIRELSCNAVDSHTAAGKSDVPFDVHLPNQLEPYFSIRDYGTGLTHDQVQNIYTTYFESTKTDSNDFIGALGLGSKSPFSYTDNFTVTAIKDNVRGVYSAFINNEGVPSIALMHSEPTDQPAGVEIQFAVEEHRDFYKFAEEAQHVYTYFKLRPVVRGRSDFEFRDVEYKDKDIIPGVHYTGTHYSRAVMGNIAYPIEVPNADQALGDLGRLLHCGLELHFAIGELDFQASREGLSYIPQTVAAIKAKLEVIGAALQLHLEKELAPITNQWEKAEFLIKKGQSNLWLPVVKQYANDTKFELLDTAYSMSYSKMKFTEKELAKKFNIQINAFYKSSSSTICSAIKADKSYTDQTYSTHELVWNITASPSVFFVTNDTAIGAYTRATYHWRRATDLPKLGSYSVYVLQAANKDKAMNTNKFFAALQGPQQFRILKASALLKKERAERAPAEERSTETVSIVKMAQKYNSRDDVGWDNAGIAANFDTTKTYYYIPLKGYTPLGKVDDVKRLYRSMQDCGITNVSSLAVYGVRKSDIEVIKTQKNWVDLEEHLTQVLNNLTPDSVTNLVLNSLDNSNIVRYNTAIVSAVTSKKSPYLKLVNKFKDIQRVSYRDSAIRFLLNTFAPTVEIQSLVEAVKTEINAVSTRYPLLANIRNYDYCSPEIAEYINLIDKSKGI